MPATTNWVTFWVHGTIGGVRVDDLVTIYSRRTGALFDDGPHTWFRFMKARAFSAAKRRAGIAANVANRTLGADPHDWSDSIDAHLAASR